MQYLDINEIKKIIPHRSPFLMIDRVESIVPQEKVIAIKCISSNEPYLEGHFPGLPIMPGVLIIESMAQAAIILASYGDIDKGNKIAYLTSIDSSRFIKKVIPGDVLRVEVSKIKSKMGFWKMKGEAFVDEELVCRAEFSAMLA